MVEVNLLTGIREHLPFNQKQAYITTGFSIASPLLESRSLKNTPHSSASMSQLNYY